MTDSNFNLAAVLKTLDRAVLNKFLLEYAATGNLLAVDALLDAGADKEVKDREGCTGLMCAASNGHALTTAHLLARGADIYAKDRFGWNSLHFAARNGHTATAEQLITKGADIYAKTDDGDTAQDLARLCDHFAIVKLLERASDPPSEPRKPAPTGDIRAALMALQQGRSLAPR